MSRKACVIIPVESRVCLRVCGRSAIGGRQGDDLMYHSFSLGRQLCVSRLSRKTWIIFRSGKGEENLSSCLALSSFDFAVQHTQSGNR